MAIFTDIGSVTNALTRYSVKDFTPEGGLAGFLSKVGYSLSLAAREKEIFLFVLLQWVSVIFGYHIWIKLYHWIPDSWILLSLLLKNGDFVTIAEIFWSIICISIFALPIGILSGCMGASHILTRQGQASTVASCLKIVIPRTFVLWSFHWRDGLITGLQMLRVFSFLDTEVSSSKKEREKISDLAWKTGVVAVIPCILSGYSLEDSANKSLDFVKDDFNKISIIRSGYSAVNRYLCIFCYIGFYSFLYFYSDDMIPAELNFRFYLVMIFLTLPLILAMAINIAVLRPVYILMMCDLYSDYLERTEGSIDLKGASSITSAIVFISLVLLSILSVTAFLDEYSRYLLNDDVRILKLLTNYLLE